MQYISHRTSETIFPDDAPALAPISLPAPATPAATLSFWGGVQNLSLCGTTMIHEVLATPHNHPAPHIYQRGRRIDLRFREYLLDPHLQVRAKSLFLADSTEWALEFRGGVADLEADLSTLQLSRLAIYGGMTNAWLQLPAIKQPTHIVISGDVGHVSLIPPADTPLQLLVRERAHDVVLNGERRRMKAGLRWRSSAADVPGYHVEIHGCAEQLRIARDCAP